jgi:hypothetical protein
MWLRRALTVLCLAATAPLYDPVDAGAALSCPARNPQPIMPDSVHGIVTRVQINPKMAQSMAFSVHPALQDQDLATWMRQMEEADVNMAQVLLAPSDRLSADQKISPADWQAYTDAALLPFYERTQAQQAAYKSIRDRITGKNGVKDVTPSQQNQILLAFLQRLEALKTEGKICGNVQFIVVLRRWFLTAPDPTNRRAMDKRLSSETVYAQTMAGFLNAAAENHLGHWLAGIMFTEYTNTDMNQALPITLDLATRINGLTGNWLRSHLMIATGGGMGDQFNGIDKVTCPTNADRPEGGYQFTCRPGRPLDFFDLISKQTGAFAFGYKLFNWTTTPTPLSYCNARRQGCEMKNLTAADWTDYLSDGKDGLGFSDLASFVNRNAAAYPQAANVIFVGNGADSMQRMVEVTPDPSGPRLTPGPQLIALSTLFQNGAQKGGGWSGRLFMDAYGDQDRLADNVTATDNGAYIFYVDRSPSQFAGTGKVTKNTQSEAYWRAWPKLPTAAAP